MGDDDATRRVRETYFRDPSNLDALRVWADALIEAQEPRGELIQLSLLPKRTPAQQKRLEQLQKLWGKLVGPARPYLRRFDFDEHGLVRGAVTEAPQLVAGFELISQLNPRLWVGVTSLKKKASHEPFSKLPLRRFSFVSLVANKLDDAGLKRIAPAFEGLLRLDLTYNNITGAGLRAIADRLSALQYLALNQAWWVPTPGQPAPDLSQIANGWVDALCDEPALRNLRVVCLGAAQPDAAHLARLKAMKGLKVVFTASAPNDLKEVEALEGH